ncbi:MotA/TolQ/ExbB proton channel family protein [Rhizobium laguerreae]|uniref:MotA/TolQ/ExbB proton channel family protein n=1 Tax=Rhizobium laguerreae TaxID=1076926 RepID=UPI00103AF902|nr:MotA/TolQ/ExbB proton channel family protein [Rhizobium laguerreae]TBY04243.1 hypothetical protein E0I94_26185 [Rhizobium laguerreae]
MTSTSSSKAYSQFVELGWGDTAGISAFSRTAVKILAALFLAWLLHEGLARTFLTLTPDKANEVAKLFEDVSKAIPSPPAKADYKSVEICIYSKPPAANGCKPTGETDPLGEGVTSGLAYEINGVMADSSQRLLATGTFFRVEKIGIISEGRIEESIDTLLRRVEIALFNGPTIFATGIKLCAGTRTLAEQGPCAQSAKLGSRLGLTSAELLPAQAVSDQEAEQRKILPGIIGNFRLASMFFGPIQFGTAAIFFYSLIETFGLWARWIAPADRLDLSMPPDAIAAEIVKIQQETDSRPGGFVLSLHDRLMVSAMAAEDRTDTDDPAMDGSRFSPRKGFVEVLSSYRDFLQEDAVGRQESLEMLGDTMLKLAFLGTVYGISAALFSARGLDTADPVLRLATKASMYAGIGLGFGTTIVGIALSIIAAIFRTNLAANWNREIGTAYQAIFREDPKIVLNAAEKVDKKTIVRMNSPTPKPPSITLLQTVGVAVVILGIIALLVISRGWIWTLVASTLNRGW